MQSTFRTLLLVGLPVLILAALPGCSTPAEHRATQSRLDLGSLSGTMRANVVAGRLVPGMSPDLVYVLLGNPGRNRRLEEPIFRPGTTWTYRGELVRADPRGLVFKSSKDWVWMTSPDEIQTLEVSFGREVVERITWKHPDGRTRTWPSQ
ncbi:MAG: hypothetical protein ACFE0O_00555 [Opitutales bacterium]